MYSTKYLLYHEVSISNHGIKFSHKISKLILALLLTIFLVACSGFKNDPLVDRSFITDSPCIAPCWYGLELDKSGEADALETLKKLPFVDLKWIKEFKTFWFEDNNAMGINYGCIHPRDELCGGIIVSRDKIKNMWQSVGYSLTVKMVVDKLGKPEYVDYGGYHPEVGGCELILAWPEKEISVERVDPKNEIPCQEIREGHGIPPETKITGIFYGVKEAYGSEPRGGLTRISWPGFSETLTK